MSVSDVVFGRNGCFLMVDAFGVVVWGARTCCISPDICLINRALEAGFLLCKTILREDSKFFNAVIASMS